MTEYLQGLISRHWRLMSLFGSIAGLILPWQFVYSDVMSFEPNPATPLYSLWEVKDAFYSLSDIDNYSPEFLNDRFVNLVFLIGVLSFALYISGNLYQIIVRPVKPSNKFLFFLQTTCVFSALILLPDFTSPMDNSSTTFGYHITAATIFTSFLLEGNENMNLNSKFPYLTAWTGIIAINSLAAIILYILLPYEVIRLLIQVIIGFFVFKFVIQRNILPYTAKTKSEQ